VRQPTAPDAQVRPEPLTTLWLALAAVVAGAMSMFGESDSFSMLTIFCALAGLLPWALVVGGVELRSWQFFLLSVPFGAVIVVIDDNPGGTFPLMLAVVWLARTAESWKWPAAGVVVSLASLGECTIENGYDESGIIYFAGGLGIATMSGLLIRRAETLAAQVAAMRDADVERLAATERARIARDVHDIVAHSLTVVMLNVTGARRAISVDPQGADEALARAELVGRDSLDSIREVMGLLRESEQGPDLPHPTLARVPQLVAGFRDAGLDVELQAGAEIGVTTIHGTTSMSAVGVDPTVELVAYRIVQESLSNVLQHAPGADATVTIALVDGCLDVAVRNTSSPRPVVSSERPGLGTRGMAERVRAVGGNFESTATSDGGWLVVARLPPRPADVHRSVTHA
jgi:signal transduction histidine kinase